MQPDPVRALTLPQGRTMTVPTVTVPTVTVPTVTVPTVTVPTVTVPAASELLHPVCYCNPYAKGSRP
jgi:hypothetical protein